MFGFPRRKKYRPRNPQPSWVKWVFLLFIAYAMLTNWHRGSDPKPHSGLQIATEELNPKKLLNLTEYKSKLFPTYTGSLELKDKKPGEGQPVICGQEVSLAYEAFLPSGEMLDDVTTPEKPLIFRTGLGEAMPVFEQGVLGMTRGGQRSLVAPLSMSYGLPQFAHLTLPKNTLVRFEVNLLKIAPLLPDMSNVPYRIATISPGGGAGVQCGDRVKVQLILWDVSGKKLFASEEGKPIEFTAGKSEVFIGLEQGVLGLAPGGVRTLVVPPPLQKTLFENNASISFPFPQAQTVLVDLTLLP